MVGDHPSVAAGTVEPEPEAQSVGASPTEGEELGGGEAEAERLVEALRHHQLPPPGRQPVEPPSGPEVGGLPYDRTRLDGQQQPPQELQSAEGLTQRVTEDTDPDGVRADPALVSFLETLTHK